MHGTGWVSLPIHVHNFSCAVGTWDHTLLHLVHLLKGVCLFKVHLTLSPSLSLLLSLFLSLSLFFLFYTDVKFSHTQTPRILRWHQGQSIVYLYGASMQRCDMTGPNRICLHVFGYQDFMVMIFGGDRGKRALFMRKQHREILTNGEATTTPQQV